MCEGCSSVPCTGDGKVEPELGVERMLDEVFKLVLIVWCTTCFGWEGVLVAADADINLASGWYVMLFFSF